MNTILDKYFFDSTKDDKAKWKKEIGLSDLEDFRIERLNWINVACRYYYIKPIDDFNEFVGEIYAKKLHLSSAHYELVRYPEHNSYKKDLFYISENFMKPNTKYLKLYDIFKDRFNPILNEKQEIIYYKNIDDINKKRPSSFNGFERFKKILSESNYKELEEQLIKLYAIDLFMRQYDRCFINMIFEKNDNGLYLGPVFDYSGSLDCESEDEFYYNDIQDIPYKRSDIKKFIKDHPQLYDYLKYLCTIDLCDELKNNLKDFGMRLSDSDAYNYYFESGLSKQRIKSFIK